MIKYIPDYILILVYDLAAIMLMAAFWVSGLWFWLWIFERIARRREERKDRS